MARVNKQFSGPALVATGPATVYTTPASTMAEIRHVHISNPTGSAVTFTMSLGADAAATRVFDAYSIPANTVLDFYPLWFIAAAVVIQLAAGTNNVLNVTISGYEHTIG